MATDSGPFAAEPDQGRERVVANAACTFCGCVCDDIALTVVDNRIVRAKNACRLAWPWFLADRSHPLPDAMIEGREAPFHEAVERAGEILLAARYPLAFGLAEASCEAQRAAVALADGVGAVLDTTTSMRSGPTGMAFQGVGEVTATLGEIKNRADLVIFWGSNPLVSHPRHFSRYSASAKGLFTLRGRIDRTVVIVDICKTRSAAAADLFLQIRPGKDFEALWTLRALVKGLPIDPAVGEDVGVPIEQWRELADRMKSCRFGAMFFGAGLSATGGRHLNVESALALTRDLNAFTCFVCQPMRTRGNVNGADNVVTWQTGYPFAVNLCRGYPRFNPGEYSTVDVLSRGEADAILAIAPDPSIRLPAPALEHWSRVPTICVDAGASPLFERATVAFRTAVYGIETAGTAYRMDEVPIPLRPATTSTHPTAEGVLQAILAAVERRATVKKGSPSDP